ncbi:glycosyltransferase family 4 protein [Pedobacter alpinus]|uniref:Glycosyltransferase family 4 protein n=1 Tax=Pedobacter alpinus TaxID=1590643 RepID=A0ABW5TNJ4_9SPHI
MRIAVNTRLLKKNKLEGIGRFTYETLRSMVLKHPEVEFIFCFDHKFDSEFIFAPNVKGLVIHPPAKHPFLYYIWFQHCLPRVLKKHKIDLLLSPDGYLPLNTKIKTLAVIHDIAFEHFENGVNWLEQKYYNYYFPKFANQATRIATVSEFSKQDLVNTYQISADKIDVVYNGVTDAFKQLSNSPKPLIPYFICVGAIHPRKNILNLLKAFEAFRKQNPTFKHQLILAGRRAWKTSVLDKHLKTMTFKTDVIFKAELSDDEINLLLNNATASIYPSYFEGFGLPVIEAFSCGTPVITSQETAMEEISKGAAHLFNPNNFKELTRKIYEQAAGIADNQQKIILGLKLAKQYNWENTSKLLWQAILKTIN